MSVELKKKICDTMGCQNAATHVLTTPSLDFDDSPVTYSDHVCEPCGQGYMRRPVLRATLTPMASLEPTPAPRSGYTACACRDCMDIANSGDTGKPELCGNCIDADCLAYNEADEREGVPSYSYDCQRDDAYEGDTDAGTGHGAYEYHSGV